MAFTPLFVYNLLQQMLNLTAVEPSSIFLLIHPSAFPDF